jgi:hypothetical protein
VNRPKQPIPQEFDPELKYSRRVPVEQTARKIPSNNNADEILKAEASVYGGRRGGNQFQGEKVQNTQKFDHFDKPTVEGAQRLADNFGRRTRVNGPRRQRPVETEVSTSTSAPDLEPTSTRGPRRLIKRLKVKTTPSLTDDSTTTFAPTTTELTTTTEYTTTVEPTTYSPHHVSASTLRPVKRIHVKTKVAQKKPEEEDKVEPPPSRSSSFSVFEKLKKFITTTTTTTTPQPDLASTPKRVIKVKKVLKQPTTTSSPDELTTPTVSENLSTVIVREISRGPGSSAILSFKEPILPKLEKKIVEVKHTVREGSTRSPDYDYAYYNTDDKDDVDATKQLDNKNYGRKPIKKGLPSPPPA